MNTCKLFLILIFCPLLLIGQNRRPVESFPLSDVRLLDSPFKNAQTVDMNYILEMDMDRLLAPFLREAGLEPKAESYGNWENTGLDGHIGGHYVSALAMMYASTGDERMKDRLDYMIGELKRAQDANGNGYIGGVPGSKELWNEIANGNIRAGAFDLNGKWVPLYNIHKTYAGLRDAYLHAGNQTAKEMLVKFTDWMIDVTEDLSDEQIQDMLRSEHGGLNETFADVAAITGDEKYLELARRFSHGYILDPLIKNEDRLTGMHANTQIPKVIGYKRVADLDNDKAWDEASQFFWETVVHNRSVSIGGNSVREHFNPVDDYSRMIQSEQGPETCNTYNMLRLTMALFLSDSKAEYMDYYERALYNHILSTKHPEKGGFVYFTPMRPGHYRVYSQPHTSFWCCVGSGLENHTKYGEMIYAHDDESLYVNLFIPSKLNWKEKGVVVVQETNFPKEESTKLTINPKKKMKFALRLRYPSWVKEGELKVWVNGKAVEFSPKQGEYLTIDRKWKKGDEVVMEIPMHTAVEQIPDEQPYYSILHGPIVLAAKTGAHDMEGIFADDSRGGHVADGERIALQEMPVIISEPNEIADKVKPVSGRPMTFTIDNLYSENYDNLELIPFYNLHESRYILYWRSETKEQMQAIKKQLTREEKTSQKLAANTIDLVFPGEQQPESDHFIESENSNIGVNGRRHWRDARGWFSYQLKDNTNKASKFRIMYWGLDQGRRFNILINDEVIAEAHLQGNKGAEFFTVDYKIPESIKENANGVYRIKFEANEGSVAGGVYEVRLMK